MISAAGALDVDYRTAVADYIQLGQLTQLICRGDQSQVSALFRLAVFNVLTENEDDHLKNLSFLTEDGYGWRLSPGYDLTWSPSATGHRATLVAGRSREVQRADLWELARQIGLSDRVARRVMCDVMGAVAQVREVLAECGCTGSVSREAGMAVRKRVQGIDS